MADIVTTAYSLCFRMSCITASSIQGDMIYTLRYVLTHHLTLICLLQLLGPLHPKPFDQLCLLLEADSSWRRSMTIKGASVTSINTLPFNTVIIR